MTKKTDTKSSSQRSGNRGPILFIVLSIDAQSFLDPVISLYQSGYIYGADYHYIDRNKSSLNTKHRYLIDHSDTWDHISTVINQFLQNN